MYALLLLVWFISCGVGSESTSSSTVSSSTVSSSTVSSSTVSSSTVSSSTVSSSTVSSSTVSSSTATSSTTVSSSSTSNTFPTISPTTTSSTSSVSTLSSSSKSFTPGFSMSSTPEFSEASTMVSFSTIYTTNSASELESTNAFIMMSSFAMSKSTKTSSSELTGSMSSVSESMPSTGSPSTFITPYDSSGFTSMGSASESRSNSISSKTVSIGLTSSSELTSSMSSVSESVTSTGSPSTFITPYDSSGFTSMGSARASESRSNSITSTAGSIRYTSSLTASATSGSDAITPSSLSSLGVDVRERSTKGNSSTGIIIGVILLVVVILLILLLAVGTLVLFTRRRRKRSVILQHDINGTLSNPMYQSTSTEQALPIKGKLGLDVSMGMSNPVYEAQNNTNVVYEKPDNQLPSPYEEPLRTSTLASSDFYSEAGMTMNTIIHEKNSQQSTANDHESLLQSHHLEWEICVPTTAQRQQVESPDIPEEAMYAQLSDVQHSSLEKHVDDDEFYFTEEKIYWKPGGDTNSLYEQLAQRKYREIPRQQIEITGHLGSGQFGTVDKGVWNFQGTATDVALKTLQSSASEEEKVKFLQEAAINGQFHHPNVVKLHGVVTVGEPTMIVLELVTHGDLRDYLERMRPVPGELLDAAVPTRLLNFCRQNTSGMDYLSKKNFVHRDLAVRNILVADKGICKIADFGMSRDLQDENYYISNAKKIPIKWTAPEALNFMKYSTSSDVWSFGVVLYEIWSMGHKPFEKKSNQQCLCLVDSGYRLPPPPGCPKLMYEMMIRCWHPETSSRPTFADLVSDFSEPDVELLHTETDTCLGAHLDTAYNLYPELQRKYI